MKKTMKRVKSIMLVAVILLSSFTMGTNVSAATAIQTKMAAKPTSMSGTQVWKLTGSSNIPGLTQGACRVGDYLYVGYNSNFVPVNYDQTQYTQPSTIGGVSKEDEGCMPQAINCDGTYIYATWFISASATGNSTGANKNYIVVYDMTGTKITEIKSELTSGREILNKERM